MNTETAGKRAETVLRPIDPGLDRPQHTRDHQPDARTRSVFAEQEGRDNGRARTSGDTFGTLLRLPVAAVDAIGQFLLSPGLHIAQHGPATQAYRTAAAITRPEAHRTVDVVI